MRNGLPLPLSLLVSVFPSSLSWPVDTQFPLGYICFFFMTRHIEEAPSNLNGPLLLFCVNQLSQDSHASPLSPSDEVWSV